MPDDTSIIAERLQERIIRSGRRWLNVESARALTRSQNPDGSWDDVDYDDASRTRWKPSRHLAHLSTLARAWATPDSELRGDATTLDAIVRGLHFWVRRDPRSDNWWFNVIGSPGSLGDLLVMLKGNIPPDLVDGVSRQIHRSGFTRTGANLVDEASNLLTLAAATDDAGLMRACIQAITSELRASTDEGSIQHDDSFHQHGPQNMVISYGHGFAGDHVRFASLFTGTAFRYPQEKIDILSRFILDGQQWHVWGRQIDYHAMGRGAFRGNKGSHVWNAAGFAGMCREMQEVHPARADEYTAFARRVTGEAPAGSTGPRGNKHFWRSDTMVHRAPGWFASIRFHSRRTYATETRTNRENLKGYHLSDGAYFVMRRGDEYHEVQPVWDYRKLPGITFRDTDDPIPYGRDARRAGNTDFVGGVSDSLLGAAAMDYDKDGVVAKKAYFFTDGGIVCLGAGISSTDPEPILSTLNQCLLTSNVALLTETGLRTIVGHGTASGTFLGIHHDGVAYMLLESADIVVRAQRQDGSWREIEEKAGDERVPRDMFTSWVDHGAGPDDATYAYRIVPGAAAADLADLSSSADIRVLSNTPRLQAVATESARAVQAIFHVPGRLVLPDGRTLAVDAACALQLVTTDSGERLSIADPSQRSARVTLEISSDSGGEDAQVVPLPGGAYAGRSVILHLDGSSGHPGTSGAR